MPLMNVNIFFLLNPINIIFLLGFGMYIKFKVNDEQVEVCLSGWNLPHYHKQRF